jgi:probable O-glycosylation ligase (exosortase A-associated)
MIFGQTSMALKHPFLDYEPLRRSTSSTSADEQTVNDKSDFKRRETSRTADDKQHRKSDDASAQCEEGVAGDLLPALRRGDPQSYEPQERNISGQEDKSEPKAVREKWILKHGHSISFGGVFLFTGFVFFRPYELFPSLSWLSSAAFWIALATLVVYALTQLGLEGTLTARPREVNLVLLLLLTGALSIPLALEPARAFNSFTEFLKVVLIFIVMINVVRTEKRLNKLWILVLIATCWLSIGALNDYRMDRLGLQGVRIKGAIGGLFDNPNDLALHLVTMIPIALALFFKSRNPLVKVLFLVTIILISGGVVATFSRGGFFALLAVGVVILWKFARRSRLLIAPVAAAVVVLFVLLAPAGYGTRVSTTSDESAMARLDDLKRSLFIAARHPLFGVGMDNYILFSNFNKATHNAYTQVASEMGVAAAAFYILFIIAPFRGLRRIEHETYQVKSRRRFYYMAIALQASLVGYIVASFFASVAYLWYIYYLVAYSVCLRRLYDSDAERPELPANDNFQDKSIFE